MIKTLNIINSEPFIKAMKDLECGKSPFGYIEATDFEIPAYEINPPADYEALQNFPNCCGFHSSIFKCEQDWYAKFPNCCQEHKKLLKTNWFNKENYKGIPVKVITQISYSEHHIISQIESADWFKEITSYIDYNVSSFGQLPNGFGNVLGLNNYLRNLQHWIKNAKGDHIKITKEQREKLSMFIDGYYNRDEAPKTDLNILYSIYQKWLKTFPFEISYFRELKAQFEKRKFFISGEPELNKYSGMAMVKLATKEQLIEALIHTTKLLLDKVNVAELLEKGIISDLNRHRLELENESLKVDTSKLTKEFTKGELKYVTALKKWLKRHKEYFEKITPLMNTYSQHFIASKMREFQESNKQRQEKAKEQERKDFETLIDKDFSYYQNIEGFKSRLLSDKLNNTPEKYFQLLHEYQEKYSNSFRYYIQWNTSNLGDEHRKIYDFITSEINNVKSSFGLIPYEETTPVKSINLYQLLDKHGFFALPKVKSLNDTNKQKLVELISTNKLPYKIAMFDYLDFLSYLEKEHFPTKYKLHKEISKWVGSDNTGRAVKGNISSLLMKRTQANKTRYTAYRNKEKVKNDYQSLK